MNFLTIKVQEYEEIVTRSTGITKTIMQGTVQEMEKEMGGQHPGMDWHDA